MKSPWQVGDLPHLHGCESRVDLRQSAQGLVFVFAESFHGEDVWMFDWEHC